MTDYDWEMQERKFENDMAAIDLEAENAQLRERVAELEELTNEKRYIPQEWYQLATTENKKLRELVAEIWPIAEYAGYEHELSRARELMCELGYEEDA